MNKYHITYIKCTDIPFDCSPFFPHYVLQLFFAFSAKGFMCKFKIDQQNEVILCTMRKTP